MARNRKVWGVLGLLLALMFVVGYGQWNSGGGISWTNDMAGIGTVTVAGPPRPEPPGPPPRITPGQIIDGVNQLIPHSKTYRPGDPGFDELVGKTPTNRIPAVGAARSLDDGPSILLFPP